MTLLCRLRALPSRPLLDLRASSLTGTPLRVTMLVLVYDRFCLC